jgi:hypothetical protein
MPLRKSTSARRLLVTRTTIRGESDSPAADTSRCMNCDCVRLTFSRAALAGFDHALLRAKYPRQSAPA